jgi:hypothetical protein
MPFLFKAMHDAAIHPPYQIRFIDPPERYMSKHGGKKMVMIDCGHVINGCHVSMHDIAGNIPHDFTGGNQVIKIDFMS